MRRFIDVVFVQPKSRYFVVLHEGKFWQLPRMNLTANSWVFRLLYKGSLKEIFVAKSQAVACERLSRTLKTYDLPKELHGLNAQRFLDWWEMNDYKWLSTKDVISLDVAQTPEVKAIKAKTPTPATPTPTKGGEPPPAQKTVIAPQAFEILQKKQQATPSTEPKRSVSTPMSKIYAFNAQYAVKPETPPKPPAPPKEVVSIPASTSSVSPSDVATPQSKLQTPLTKAQIIEQKPATPPKAPATPVPTPTPAPTIAQQTSDDDPDLDIFDNLLKELNEEVLHG